MEINKNELTMIIGGGITGTIINAFARGINVLLELGRSLGTAIRRIGSNNICSI